MFKTALLCVLCVAFIFSLKQNAYAADSTYCDMRYYSLASDPKPIPQVTSKPTFKPLVQSTPKTTQPVSTPVEIESMISQYSDQFGVDKEKMKQIAYCESRYNPNAVNGPYGGMYQYLASTWSSTRKQMGLDANPDLRFNAEESIKTTAFKIAKQGTGPWSACSQN